MLTGPEPLPRLLDKVREAFGLTTVGRAATPRRALGHLRLLRPPGLRPPRAGRRRRRRRHPTSTSSVSGRALPAADRRLLEAVAGQALLALRNQQIAAEAAEARRRADATELRTALLSAVGHDLRTPLASIKAAAGGLRDPHLPLSDDDRSELAATIDESADRLTRVVNNLLDSSRHRHRSRCTPDLRPVGYDEIAALRTQRAGPRHRRPTACSSRSTSTLPEVLADPGLLERVIANIVDNALRHGAGAPVALRASSHADQRPAAHRRPRPRRAGRPDRTPVHPVPAPRRPHPPTGSGSG